MEYKGPFINELPLSGEVTLLAVVLDKDLRPKRNGGLFLALRFADRSGELDGKVWDNPESVSQSFERDDVVKVRGTVEVYNEKPQIIVSRIRRCEPKEYNAADFYASSSRDPEEMFGELQGFVSMVRDEALRQLLDNITNDAAIGSRLKSAPAAMKIHHAFRGGLLEHILSLCNLSVALCAHYPRLNLDLLIAGAILHDLGKVETLELSGVRFTYTTRGQLIEHVTLGLEILERYTSRIPDFPIELKTILQHLLVSHHGDLDKGALRRPMLPEAFVLSLLDLMDARLEQAYRLIDSAPSGDEFTPYIPSLERQLFRGFAVTATKTNGQVTDAEGGVAP
jgi:3'-5' exoribonuclease